MRLRAQHFYEFGPFRLDTVERQLRREAEPVPLTPKSLDLLLALVEQHGHIVEKQELMETVWPDTFVEETNLTKNIFILRQALGEATNGQKYIETVPKRGYRFVAEVREVGERDGASGARQDARVRGVVEGARDNTGRENDNAESLRGAAATANDVATTPRLPPVLPWAPPSWRRVAPAVLIASSALLIAAAISAYYYLSQSRPGLTDKTAIDSIAVMPLVNTSANPEVEYLSDGISESLINALSQLHHLKVIARSSSFKYKGGGVDPQEVARTLGVKAILTGRILQRGEKLLISAELMDARDGTQVWGEQYDRKASDLFALQAEISREIAETLRLRLTAGERRQLAKPETVNPRAYELLLKGRFNWNKGRTQDRKKAVEYYQQAIDVDPAYALAYADLSLRYCFLIYIRALDPKEYRPKAEVAAYKALELDESLAEAHLAMAIIKLAAWEWAAAELEFKRAIELNPNLARARGLYSFYLSLRGRHEQAFAEGQGVRELDPLSPAVNFDVGYRLLLARQNDQAIEAAKKTLELDENYPDAHNLLGYAYAAKGQYPEAIAAYQEGIRLGDDTSDIQIYLGAAYAKAGEREKARAILKRLARTQYVSPAALAALYVALGELEQALASLERAYAAHDIQLQFLGVDPNLDPLRSDPRFQDLVRRVGLAQ